MKVSPLLAIAPLIRFSFAKPAPYLKHRELNITSNIGAIVQGVTAAVSQGDPTGVVKALQNIARTNSVPTTPEQAAASLQSILNGTAAPPANLYEYIANLEALNLIDSIDSLLEFVKGVENGQDSPRNNNKPAPDVIYPKKLSCDAPYSIDEETLRAAIYIPPDFTYGKVPPVILFPGTGNYGYETFKGNLIPLLTANKNTDPVWVNVPGRELNDAQKNSEFAAYTINYIASITGTNVTMLTWSQGGINTQWAFKYWPSTTTVTTNHIATSPDYKGTLIANFAALPGEPLPPSLLQQEYLDSSNYITTLRSFDGDSAYVPTTTIYSGFLDEIVEPQQGVAASAYLNDVRGVGVNNYQVQLVCPLQPAGSFYTHEGVMYNPLSYYLLLDAMKNGGPGDVKRLDLPSVCATYLTPGLDVGDLLVTENALAIAGLAILTYPNPVFTEPRISSYASTSPVSTCLSTTTSSTTSTATTTSLSSTSYSTSTTSTYVSTSSSSSSSSSCAWCEWSSTSTSSISSGPAQPTTATTTPTSESTFALSWETWSSHPTPEPVSASDSTATTPSQTWGAWTTLSVPGSPAHVTTTERVSGTVTYTQTITIPGQPTPTAVHGGDWSAWSSASSASAGKAASSSTYPDHEQTTDAIAWSAWSSQSSTSPDASATTSTSTSGQAVESGVWNAWGSSPGADETSVPSLTVSVVPTAAAAAAAAASSSSSSTWAVWSQGAGGAVASGPAWSKPTGSSLNGTATGTALVGKFTGAAARASTRAGAAVVAVVAGVVGLLAV